MLSNRLNKYIMEKLCGRLDVRCLVDFSRPVFMRVPVWGWALCADLYFIAPLGNPDRHVIILLQSLNNNSNGRFNDQAILENILKDLFKKFFAKL